MIKRFIVCLFLLIVLTATNSAPVTVTINVTSTSGNSDEEFIGPFASWICARSAASGTCGVAAASFCNAAADGSTDDTTALQNCINSLSVAHPIIYMPQGNYKITSSLSITSTATVCAQAGQCVYISIIGHDPTDTKITWAGSSAGKMVLINGFFWGALNRITLDGGGLAGFFVDQAWDNSNTSGKLDDSGWQYADDVFQNPGTNAIGYRCGTLGFGCSETELIRDTFNAIPFGVNTCDFNAVDIWIWYSKFISNQFAVSNGAAGGCGAGQYHIAGSVFLGSTSSDIWSGSGGNYNVLDSYSSGSQQFAKGGAQLTVQRTRIINTVDPLAIDWGVRLILLSDAIKSVGSGPAVFDNNEGGAILSLGNTYTVSDPLNHAGDPFSWQVYWQSGDITDLTGASINTTQPVLPSTPPIATRTIYESAPSGSGTTCSSGSPCAPQAAICKASNGSSSTFSTGACTGSPDGLKSVAHLQAGSYTIAATMVVPANSNAQVIGDGGLSILVGNTGVNPVLKVNGPSHVVLRNFQVQGTTGTDVILMTGVDQAGATVFLCDSLIQGSGHSMFLDALSNVLVEAHDIGVPYTTSDVFRQTGPNQTNVFFGWNADEPVANLSGGANLQLVAFWNDFGAGASATPPIVATGGGSVIYSTGEFLTGTNIYELSLNNYTGVAALLNSTANYLTTITGSGAGTEVVGFNGSNTLGGGTTFMSNTATGNTEEFFNNAALTDSSPVTLSTISTALSHFITTAPILPITKGPGITGIEMYRVVVTGVGSQVPANAMHLTP